MLEAMQHGENAFLTLTYADEHLPVLPNGQATLVPKHAQDFLKRFRKSIEPIRVRYFLVGEYGDETQRPHYHLALFGYPSCLYGTTRISAQRRVNGVQKQYCCERCETVKEAWGLGNTYGGELSQFSAQYIAGYVVKKLTRKDDPKLNGRYPEYARMSLRPGIGADAMHEVASTLMQFNLEETQDDVPSSLRHGKKFWPLGRYLVRRLRKLTGKEENAPQKKVEKIQDELSDVRKSAFDASQSFASALEEKMKGHRLNYEGRAKINRTRKTI